MNEDLLGEIQSYCNEHWEEILDDIRALVEIESTQDLTCACEGAPYGPGPKMALLKALEIAERLGFEAHNCEGHIAFADFAGREDSSAQLGIIGHVDVVDAGPGWTFPAFELSQHDDYLIGRGVMDDKGPLIIALHALAFWKRRGVIFPFTTRVLIGACEETSMNDVAYYRARYANPDFLFTPDGQFPLCYGEAGIAHGCLTSAPFSPESSHIVAISGGAASNAVPGFAFALLRGQQEAFSSGELVVEAYNANTFPLENGTSINLEPAPYTLVKAFGKSAHASLPHEGTNAIGMLVNFLLERHVGSAEEQKFLQLLARLYESNDGQGLNIDCSDEHFSPLTAVGTLIEKQGNCWKQTIDFRYPTSTSAEAISRSINILASASNASFSIEHNKEPFLMSPTSPWVSALMQAYCQVTGEESKPITSQGGTYARLFSSGVCFGPERPQVNLPSWVGGLHSANEGASVASLKEAFEIYALGLGNLASCSW